MQRTASAVCAALISGMVAIISAQVVPLVKEPHHRVLLDTVLLRILDVTIPPGETTLDHQHDRDVATVALENSTTRTRAVGQEWGEPRMRTRGSLSLALYTGVPPSPHRLEVVDKQAPYHLIAVENLRSGGWLQTKPVMAPGTTVVQENRSFITYDVKLGGDTPTANHPHEMSVVLVLLSGAVEISGNGGSEPSRLSQADQWVFIPGGHQLKMLGDAAHLVEMEIR